MREIFTSFVDAWVRFWDNRFHRDDEVEYLRMEVDKLHANNLKLLNYILKLNSEYSPRDLDNDLDEIKEPLNKKYIPWSIKRQQLEKESIEKLERDLLLKNEMKKETQVSE